MSARIETTYISTVVFPLSSSTTTHKFFQEFELHGIQFVVMWRREEYLMVL
jgi:hypothetical protein